MLHFGLTPVDRILWFVTITANVSVIALLLRGKHFKLFPCFLAFNIFTFVKSVTLVAVRFTDQPTAYFFVYYFGALIGCGFTLLVALEIAADIFAPYSTIPPKNVANLMGAGMVAAILSLAISEFFGYRPKPQWWDAILTIDRFSRFLIVSILGGIAYVVRDMGLPWFKHNRGLATGLGFAMLMQGILSLIAGTFNRFNRPFVMSAYIIGQVIWLHTFSDRWAEPEMPTLSDLHAQVKKIREVRELLSSISG